MPDGSTCFGTDYPTATTSTRAALTVGLVDAKPQRLRLSWLSHPTQTAKPARVWGNATQFLKDNAMLFKTKIIVPETHRGLLFKDEQFVTLLDTGVHEFWDLKTRENR